MGLQTTEGGKKRKSSIDSGKESSERRERNRVYWKPREGNVSSRELPTVSNASDRANTKRTKDRPIDVATWVTLTLEGSFGQGLEANA